MFSLNSVDASKKTNMTPLETPELDAEENKSDETPLNSQSMQPTFSGQRIQAYQPIADDEADASKSKMRQSAHFYH